MITLIDTEKTDKKNIFLLTQCRYDGFTRTCAEKESEYETRLQAACVNVGLVARWLVDRREKAIDGYRYANSVIILQSDTINEQQFRFENEHNILISILQPSNGFEAQKNLSLYKSGVLGDFGNYFDRAKKLISDNNITLILSDKVQDLTVTRYLADYNLI